MADFRLALERVVNKYNRLEARPLDFGTGELLHPSEIHAIEAIGDAGTITVTVLAARFGITKGAVSQMMAKLEAKGYVRREKGRNEKEIDISLTGPGRIALGTHAKLHAWMDKSLAAEFAQLGPVERAALRRAFSVLDRMLDSWTDALKSGCPRF